MEAIFNFCEIYAWQIIAVFVVVIMLILLNLQSFKMELYKLMLQAKRMAKDEILKSGDEQIEWIVMAVYLIMPRPWTIFISEQKLRVIIKYLYGKLKKYVEDERLSENKKA